VFIYRVKEMDGSWHQKITDEHPAAKNNYGVAA
jgi:hypothetical protein